MGFKHYLILTTLLVCLSIVFVLPKKTTSYAIYTTNTVNSTIPSLKELVSVWEEPTLNKEQACMVMAVYHEARGETLEGQLSVAYVILNRVKEPAWPNTICKVVHQKNQFSFTHDGIPDNFFKRKPYLIAKKVVDIAYRGWYKDPTNGATMYHSKKVEPYWTDDMEHKKDIGNHRFYEGF